MDEEFNWWDGAETKTLSSITAKWASQPAIRYPIGNFANKRNVQVLLASLGCGELTSLSPHELWSSIYGEHESPIRSSKASEKSPHQIHVVKFGSISQANITNMGQSGGPADKQKEEIGIDTVLQAHPHTPNRSEVHIHSWTREENQRNRAKSILEDSIAPFK